ncbi:hypothetical protein IKW75_03595 [Candidatus Saccharibacteria bacterium]|nr:hypothetical protein [Candidatus Saccharibacteria bacterium]
MNNKEYLEQIAIDTKRAKTSNSKMRIFGLDVSPKLLIFLVGAIVASVLIIIIGSIASSNNTHSERDLVDRIYLRSNNLSSVISNFNKRVKSSELRSMGTSLNAVLTETSYSISAVLKNDFGVGNPSTPNKESIATEETNRTGILSDDLETGRLKGQLDRVYASDFAYEIAMLLSLESEASAKTNKESLKSALATSSSNLEKLYEQFNSFDSN